MTPTGYLKLFDEKHVFESDTLPAALTGQEAGLAANVKPKPSEYIRGPQYFQSI